MLKKLKCLGLLVMLFSCQNTPQNAAQNMPSTPTQAATVAQAPSALSAEVISPTQIQLQWQSPPDHKGFTLYLNDEIVASNLSENQYLLQGLSPFSNYTVQVQMHLENDLLSKSEPLKITTPYTPAAAVEKIKGTEQRVLAIEVSNVDIIALSAKKQTGTLSNPDGTLFYASDLYLHRITPTGEHTQSKLNQTVPLYLTENIELQSGTLKRQKNGDVLAFTNHKTKAESYLMSGTLYTLNAKDEVTEKTLFQDLNQGWFAYFQERDLYHFSFTQYFLVKNTERVQDITPQEALATYQSKRKELSQELL